MMCANGEVAPFVGHNAFLRWSALQDAAFVDGDVDFDADHEDGARHGEKGKGRARSRTRGGQIKIWSEDNVSEDFDMALRLLRQGYIVRFAQYLALFLLVFETCGVRRWATYSKGGFKEGVSLTVDDELNRWQKYAYGCNECVFRISWCTWSLLTRAGYFSTPLSSGSTRAPSITRSTSSCGALHRCTTKFP
jgi:hypothetical protein